MKPNRLVWVLFSLSLAVSALQLSAEQTNDLSSVTFTRIVFRIPSGKKIGAYHEGLLKVAKAPYTWTEGMTFGSDEFRLLACEEMRKKGYRAVGGENILFGKDESVKAEFQLGATVESLEINSYGKYAGNYSESVLTVEWQLNDLSRNEVVLKKTTRGNGRNQGVGNECVKIGFLSALDNLLAENEFNQILQVKQAGNGNTNATNAEAPKLTPELIEETKTKAERGDPEAQLFLGTLYYTGNGMPKDLIEAVKWQRKAAEQGMPQAQYLLGLYCSEGLGVNKDESAAVQWYRKAAEQGYADAQAALGSFFFFGKNVTKDYVEAYKWMNLASAQGVEIANQALSELEREMTREQIAEGQRLAREFKPRKELKAGSSPSSKVAADSGPVGGGTGFFITDDGFLITNEHVVHAAARVRLVTSAGLIDATVVKVDVVNDLALLKAAGRFAPLPVATSRGMKLGVAVVTVGFPNVGMQGFAPKFARGEIASLSGAADDARYFQISVPVQPGNSGGALVDEHGNVVGVVSAKLDAVAALKSSGSLPENVNYAVKSSFLLSFLESVPAVSARLKEPITADRKFEEVVKSAQDAAVLVLVY